MSELHLIRLVVDRRAAARGVKKGAWDDGYFLHATLTRLFADSPEDDPVVPLLTFCEDDTHGRAAAQDDLFVLAYADRPADDLAAQMGPARAELVRECVSRPMPPIPKGTSLAFRTRVCPVVRVRRDAEGEPATDRRGRKRSREVDAWLAARFNEWTARPPELGGPWERSTWEWTTREEVYAGWLDKQLQRPSAGSPTSATVGSATVGSATMESFQRRRLHRKGGGRPERPDVILTGRLEVDDEDGFRDVLARGLGRHRGFGFGMLRVRPG